jgi:hypothetical protein
MTVAGVGTIVIKEGCRREAAIEAIGAAGAAGAG